MRAEGDTLGSHQANHGGGVLWQRIPQVNGKEVFEAGRLPR